MKFGCNRPSSFRGDVIRNCGRTDDGQLSLPILKAPPEPSAQVS